MTHTAEREHWFWRRDAVGRAGSAAAVMTGWWATLRRRRPAESGDLTGGVSRALAEEVLGRLRQLDLVAAGARRSAVEVERIREQLRQLIGLWRRLLQAHAADETGRCPQCRTWRRSRRRWPCAVWWLAHEKLVTYEFPAVIIRWECGLRCAATGCCVVTWRSNPQPGRVGTAPP